MPEKQSSLYSPRIVLNQVAFLAVIAEEVWSLEDTLATLTARFHKKVVLDMYVWTDDRDSQRHIIYVRSDRASFRSFNNHTCAKAQDCFGCTL